MTNNAKKYSLRLSDRYITAMALTELVHPFDHRLIGGTGGYRYSGDTVLPADGGQVSLEFLEVTYTSASHNREKSRSTLFSFSYRIPKAAVKWYHVLNPELNPWQAPVNNFSISGEIITDEMIDIIKAELAGNT